MGANFGGFLAKVRKVYMRVFFNHMHTLNIFVHIIVGVLLCLYVLVL